MVQLAGGGIIGPSTPPKLPPSIAPRPVASEEDAQLQALRDLMSSLSQPQNIDFEAQAQQMYAPQFSYLDKLASDSTQRAEGAKKDLAGLYGNLASNIAGQEGGIKQNYDTGIKSVGDAYNQALGQVNNTFDASRNNQAAILKRLGIQQAGENVVGKSNQMEQLLTGILGANNLSSQNAMRQSKQGAITYNTAQSGAAKLAGADAQAGIGRQLADFISQIGGKRAELQGKVSESAFGMQQDQQKSMLQQAQDDYKRMIDQRDFDYRRAKDKADLELKSASQLGGDKPKVDPLGTVSNLATDLYGNPQAADNAIESLMSAYQQDANDDGEVTLGTLLSTLQNRIEGGRNGGAPIQDWPNLQRLAAQLLAQKGM